MVPYDRLVIATGSYPFVPPIEGRNAQGCFVYRTIEDLVQIETWAKRAKVGAVIGGGLLGLEAANALVRLGLETHVVELAPRLMPVQIDDSGGGRATSPRSRRSASRFTSPPRPAQCWPTTAPFEPCSFGRRHRAPARHGGLLGRHSASRRARAHCGPRVGQRGGIVVDDSLPHRRTPTSSPSENARWHAGRSGASSPPATPWPRSSPTARSAASRRSTGADLSTKLKLLGIDVASLRRCARADSRRAGHRLQRSRSPTFTRSSSSPTDGTHVLGGILVGDATAYGSLRADGASRMPVPGASRRADPAPRRTAAARRRWASRPCPTTAMICSCNNVTQGRHLRRPSPTAA